MTSISSSSSDPSPRQKAAETQAQASETGQKSPVQGANPQPTKPDSAATRAESAANPSKTAGERPLSDCLKVELNLPPGVLAALDAAAIKTGQGDEAAGRDAIAADALAAHLRSRGFRIDPPESLADERAEPVPDKPKPVKAEPDKKPIGHDCITLSNEILFDIITEAHILAGYLELLNPVQGMLDTAEAMAFPKDANGRCGLDEFAGWTQKLLGVDLEQEMREHNYMKSVEVYRSSMLIPELIIDAVRHRLQRLGVFAGVLQRYADG